MDFFPKEINISFPRVDKEKIYSSSHPMVVVLVRFGI